MKIAILYICTGKYVVFWKDFYESCERYFLPQFSRHYFVFTDAPQVHGESENPNIHRVFQQRLGWPDDTLMRFHLFDSIRGQLQEFDYIYFFNANAIITRPIQAEEVLPNVAEKLVAVQHPGYYNQDRSTFTYESKRKRSSAYIPKSKGKHYFAGGLNGGRAGDYLEMIATLKKNVDIDKKRRIIAVWHDESHLNRYLLDKNVKILSPAFLYPEGWDLPFEPVVLIRDKAKVGGHAFLRDVTVKKPLRKRLTAFVRNLFKK